MYYTSLARDLYRQYELQRLIQQTKNRLAVLQQGDFPEQAQEWRHMRMRMCRQQIGYAESQLASMR